MTMTSTRTHMFRTLSISRSRRRKLEALLRHLGWLRNQAIEYARTRYKAAVESGDEDARKATYPKGKE